MWSLSVAFQKLYFLRLTILLQDKKFLLCHPFFLIEQYLFTTPNTWWYGNVAKLIKDLESGKVTI